MAIVDPSSPNAHLRGKIGGIVYSRQPDGTLVARSVGVRKKPPSKGERKGQLRMQLGHPYVRSVLGDAELSAIYATEAAARNKRTCDVVMADFLSDPVIMGIDATPYHGLPGGCVLVVTGDDFKVVAVGVVLRNAAGVRIEAGDAVPAQGSVAKVWKYTARQTIDAGQTVTVEVTATDRARHSTRANISHLIQP